MRFNRLKDKINQLIFWKII